MHRTTIPSKSQRIPMCFPLFSLTEPFPSVNTQRQIAGLQASPGAWMSTAPAHWLKGAMNLRVREQGDLNKNQVWPRRGGSSSDGSGANRPPAGDATGKDRWAWMETTVEGKLDAPFPRFQSLQTILPGCGEKEPEGMGALHEI